MFWKPYQISLMVPYQAERLFTHVSKSSNFNNLPSKGITMARRTFVTEMEQTELLPHSEI